MFTYNGSQRLTEYAYEIARKLEFLLGCSVDHLTVTLDKVTKKPCQIVINYSLASGSPKYMYVTEANCSELSDGIDSAYDVICSLK